MDQEIKQEWVKALRSGDFKQGRGKLRNGDGYCCLGVLCQVIGVVISDDGEVCLGEQGTRDGYAPLYEIIGRTQDSSTLWMMNDRDKASFPEIADYIEANM